MRKFGKHNIFQKYYKKFGFCTVINADAARHVLTRI